MKQPPSRPKKALAARKDDLPTRQASPDQFKRLLDLLVPGNWKWDQDGGPRAMGAIQPNDIEAAWAALLLDRKAAKEALGADGLYAVGHLLRCLKLGVNHEGDNSCLQGPVGVLRAMEPRNAIEGMLMAQMLLMHQQATRLIAMSTEDDLRWDQLFRLIETARACARAFQEGMEALTRFRSGGKQQVVVSHVAVEAGGQAAIAVGGNVQGGGVKHA